MKHNLEETLNKLIPKNNFALGNDLVFLPDFKLSFNPLFKQKVYTPLEIDYCELFEDSILRYASTWAAKEAVYKAIKQINSKALPFKKIEILREKISGKPEVKLSDYYKNLKISLTISHDGEYVWAAAMIRI
ncbi:holo-ACP synthase [Pedobacter puniceum]|jgi:holo-[acyl-carrier protein] synthase|uniref:4'-phosphopantetheinyl transferase superfamily protein n=1 Tax=Pedobacter puniceum TaxID=2666136 RepID=A0A7K0FMF8_9SPHI|nr:4'-phosphopantetheinyl transferase superfamily protein [Pedobacter puniceum]MRX47154.1 4'-phosphopantetheinyl transferase superfamily protein [Pedobacter puniceum]